VLTIQEAGNVGHGISDEAVLAFAIEHNRAVVTMNRRNFIRLHRQQSDHAGIIVCTQDTDTEGQAERIHHAISATETLTG
jgi:hypothetical protein